jgi:hypothetical protein
MAYLAQLREQARTQYFVDLLVWASLAPYMKEKKAPPSLPKILKG